jgi:hypothetical protein
MLFSLMIIVITCGQYPSETSLMFFLLYVRSFPMSTPNFVYLLSPFRQTMAVSMTPRPHVYSSPLSASSYAYHVPILHSKMGRPNEFYAL